MSPDLDPDDVAAALALSDDEIPSDLDSAEPLLIPDRRYANRVLRRLAILNDQQASLIADADAEIAALDALVGPEKDRIHEFLEDRVHGIERLRAWLLHGLEGWTRAVAAADPKAVTTKVTGGEVRLRKNPDRLVIVDPVLVAKIMPEAVKPAEVQVAVVKAATGPGTAPYAPPEGSPALEPVEGYEARVAVTASGDVLPGVAYLVAKVKRFEWDAR